MADKKKDWNDLFILYDKENNGKISTKQLPKFCAACGIVVEKRDMMAAVSKFDKDNGGLVSFDDFWNTFSEKEVITKEQIADAFKTFDKEGFVNQEELKYVMTNLGEKITEPEADKFFTYFKVENGKVDYKSFLKDHGIEV